MDFKKFLPGKNEGKEDNFFWTLIIEPGWVQVGIWKIENGSASVVFSGKPVAWSDDSQIVDICNSALSIAAQNLPDGIEPSKTVLGISYSWLDSGDIAPERLQQIKDICRKLSLSVVGFVVIAEAVANLLKSETGANQNLIVLGIYQKDIELSLFFDGKLYGMTQIARSLSLADDVVEGLSRLSVDKPLPPRILVYDGRSVDLADAQQDLLEVDWGGFRNINFLHEPKVDVVDDDRKVLAVSLAGASELAGINKVTFSLPTSELSAQDELKAGNVEDTQKTEEFRREEALSEDVGFKVERQVDEEIDSLNAGQELDFPEYGNLSEAESNVVSVEENKFVSDSKPHKLSFIGSTGKIVLSGLASLVKGVARVLSTSGGNFSFAAKPFLWGGSFLIVFAISAGVYWWFAPKATITIYLSPKRLEESLVVSVATDISEPDFAAKKIPGRVIEKVLSGEKTTQTTGTKRVGEKATGEVTIYRSGPEITIPAGTNLVGPGNLKFVIESPVTVASGSASQVSQTTVSVRAVDIGAEYNLASGTVFSIGNYSSSDMEAKNSSSFSGGSSRQVQAVAKEDYDGLREDLINELLEKAENEIGKEVGNGNFLIKQSLASSVQETKFSHNIGDEAENLKLFLQVKFRGIVVSKDDLGKVTSDSLSKIIPGGYVLDSNNMDFSFENLDKKGDSYEFRLTAVANLLPQVSVDDIKKKIKGKHIEVAKVYLKEKTPAFGRAEIKIKPSFPGRLKTLPHVERNIQIQFMAEK
jgi:hypothetical protein